MKIVWMILLALGWLAAAGAPLLLRGRWKGPGWMVSLVAVFYGLTGIGALLADLFALPPMMNAMLGEVIILLVVLIFALTDGGGFRTLGLTGSWKAYDVGIIPALLATNVVGSVLFSVMMQATGQNNLDDRAISVLTRAFGTYSTGPFIGMAFLLALLAGVCEEMLFRGYLITRLERLGMPAWGCILASGFAFGLVHWSGYGFIPALSKALFFGIPTGIFFWYRRSLGPLVVAHALMDFLGFVAVFALIKLFPGMPGL